MANATDYTMTSRDANELKGVVLLPFEFRQKLLAKYAADHGADALIDLFANFIGMANQAVENSHEALWLLGIIKGGMNDRDAEKINSSSLFGALQGVELANRVDQAKTCEGCAFRLGTLANQSPSTTTDAQWCADGVGMEGDRFMCHEGMGENDEPTRPCAGFAQVMGKLGRAKIVKPKKARAS